MRARDVPMPLDDRLYRAAQHVVRSRLFFDLWLYFVGPTRPKVINTMREYNEFFRFTPHAYFVTYIVHISAMFDRNKGTISLPRLAKEMKQCQMIQPQGAAEVEALLAEAAPIASKVRILRHNAFAHQSADITYDEAFKEADVVYAQLRELTEMALKVVNQLLIARGLRKEVFTTLPREAAQAMMSALSARLI